MEYFYALMEWLASIPGMMIEMGNYIWLFVILPIWLALSKKSFTFVFGALGAQVQGLASLFWTMFIGVSNEVLIVQMQVIDKKYLRVEWLPGRGDLIGDVIIDRPFGIRLKKLMRSCTLKDSLVPFHKAVGIIAPNSFKAAKRISRTYNDDFYCVGVEINSQVYNHTVSALNGTEGEKTKTLIFMIAFAYHGIPHKGYIITITEEDLEFLKEEKNLGPLKVIGSNPYGRPVSPLLLAVHKNAKLFFDGMVAPWRMNSARINMEAPEASAQEKDSATTIGLDRYLMTMEEMGIDPAKVFVDCENT